MKLWGVILPLLWSICIPHWLKGAESLLVASQDANSYVKGPETNKHRRHSNDTRFIASNHTHLQFVGRYLQINIPLFHPEIRFDHPGFRIQMVVTDVTEVSLLLRAIRLHDSGQPQRFWIYVNNRLLPEVIDTSSFTDDLPREVVIAGNLDKSLTYHIHVVKVTEFDIVQPKRHTNCVQLAGFLINKGGRLLRPPALPTRRIEFIGDSIMAGYCNLCEDSTAPVTPVHIYTGDKVSAHSPLVQKGEYGLNPWGYKQGSFALSWPSLVCATLRSTCHTVAWSGFGMVRHCCQGEVHIPDIYYSALGSDSSSPQWNFSSWVPDAVVINLGTNDHLDLKPKGSVEAHYVDTYVEFVLNISTAYGSNTQFFLGCGPMSDTYCGHLSTVISKLRHAHKYLKVHFLDHRGLMDQSNSCCNHPNAAAGDVALAHVASKFIASTMNWGTASSLKPTSKETSLRRGASHCDGHKGWLLPCDP